ncbi:MAG: hypothetical protein WBQ94_09380 [Terracidiphilus sp.]
MKIDGDYYPRWLENFVQALMDPVPMAANFRARTATSLMRDSQILTTQASRNDRTNGITDPMTEGSVIFAGPEFLIRSTSMFNNSMIFSDWAIFEGKKIAQTYETKLLDRQKLTGHLVVLEELQHPKSSIFTVRGADPLFQSISTRFIPTSQEEGLLEKAPDLEWPSVRDGRTDGYMIVYARTDRTGQVRETAEYSSHNPAVEKAGMEQALKYKFKPLIVDGVPVQFETPLVLHFISRIENPIPILTIEEMKQQMTACTITDLPKAPVPSGNVLHYRVSVDERGVFAGLTPIDSTSTEAWNPALRSIMKCKFKPYIVNGQPTYYTGEVELIAQ